MKVIIVGLPLFAKRLKDGLTNYDPFNKYIHLDTYYNKADKLKALLHIRRTDCIYSINGTVQSSRLFDLAFKKNIPVIMNWVGTDVLKAIEAYKNNKHQQHCIDQAIHYCEVDWIQEELKEIGIDAEVVNFAAFTKSYELKEVSAQRLNVLSYIPEIRSEFYGIQTIIRVANKFPSIDFSIAGTEAHEFEPLPENLKALGWVSDMNALYEEVHACIRYTDHDGLSTFILESLARGKEVLYRNPFNYCNHCPDEDQLEQKLVELEANLREGKSLLNEDGAHFIRDNFNEAVIFGGLINKILRIVK